ncbi:hypothetical protein U5B43_08855 [Campylobacter sp. 9BO]|uniref:hypothetical protein n=1 Tax=Campylobacter sp. 9BO TaxID=3424759 RepID=UPI003D343F69
MVNLNLAPLDLFYAVLDKHFGGWEARADEYYLTELAYLIGVACESKFTDETIINNLKISSVDKYQTELNAILHFSVKAVRCILDNRMSADRLKATQSRYLGKKHKKKIKAKSKNTKERSLF